MLAILFPLMVGVQWLISLPGSFSILTFYIPLQVSPPSNIHASTSLCSLSPWHQPQCAYEQGGEDGDTKGLGVCSGFDRHIRARRSHNTSWKEGWGAETLWIEKICGGAAMTFPNSEQPVQRPYQQQGRQAGMSISTSTSPDGSEKNPDNCFYI